MHIARTPAKSIFLPEHLMRALRTRQKSK